MAAANRSGEAAPRPQPATPTPIEALPRRVNTERQKVADLQRSAWWWLRAAALGITLLAAWQIFGVVRGVIGALLDVLFLLIFGGIIALLAEPLITQLHQRLKLPRSLAIGLVLLIGLVATLGGLFLVARPLVGNAQSLYNLELPKLITGPNSVVGWFQRELRSFGFQVSAQGILQSGPAKPISTYLPTILEGVNLAVQAGIGLLVSVVAAFWILQDGEKLKVGGFNFLPARVRSEVEFALNAYTTVIGGYVRGQLIMAALVGSLAGVGCFLLGVPFPLTIGVVAGVFELIPLVGAFIGGAIAILLALTISPGLGLLTLALFIAIHILEAYFVAPRVQGRFIQLHPLVVMLTLLAGAELGGFLGALVAVPVVSLGAVFLRAGVGDWRQQRPELFIKGEHQSLRRRRTRLLERFPTFQRKPLDKDV